MLDRGLDWANPFAAVKSDKSNRRCGLLPDYFGVWTLVDCNLPATFPRNMNKNVCMKGDFLLFAASEVTAVRR